MAHVILLPKPRDTANSWPSEGGTIAVGEPITLQKAKLIKNLDTDAHLSAEGIPSPWARALVMNWRLEDQNAPTGIAAISEMRALVLAQFLDRLRGELVVLTNDGSEGFSRLCKALRLGERYDSLIFWRAHNLIPFAEGEMIAGTTSDCLFFSAGDLDVEALTRALRAIISPRLYSALFDVKSTEPDFAATLAQYLGYLAGLLPGSPWRTALETWQTELNKVGGNPVMTATKQFMLVERLPIVTRVWVDQTPWDCPECVTAGKSWLNAAGTEQNLTQALTAQQAKISCQEHRVLIRKDSGMGDAVSFADFGCYKTKRYDASRKEFTDHLYVWYEPVAWPKSASRSRVIVARGQPPYVEHRFNNQTVRVEGQLIKLSDVLLDEVAWPLRTDTAKPAPVDVPIRGEFASLLEDCEADPVAPLWKLRLKGYPGEVTRNFPDRSSSTSWAKSAILIWPPEEIQGWAVDYIAASAPNADRLAFRTIELDPQHGGLKLSPDLRLLGLYRTNGSAIRYVELGEIDRQFQSLGLLRVNRNPVEPRPGPRADVVIDFGTSNSAALWKLTDQEPEFLYSGVGGDHPVTQTFSPTTSADEVKNLERAVSLMLGWYEEDHPRPFVPSLLAEPDDLHSGGCCFIPPRPLALRLLMRPTERRLFAKLKWDDWSQSRTQQRVAALLEALLLPVFWDLRKKGVTAWTLRATYPLAFKTAGGNKAETYEKIVNDTVRNLVRKTDNRPSRVGLPEPDFVELHSESAAGAALLQHGNSTHEVSLDLGGGTLDVAVVVGPQGQRLCQAPPGTVLAADSLSYAGRDLIRAIVAAYGDILPRQLASKFDSSAGSQQTTDRISPDILVEQLEVIINRDGVDGLARVLAEKGNGLIGDSLALARQSLRLRWEALLAGIKLYLRILLEGAIRNPKPGVVPMLEQQRICIGFNVLGQGWELLKFLHPDGAATYLRDCLQLICSHVAESLKVKLADEPIVNVLRLNLNPKTALVQGALGLGRAPAQSPTAFLARNADTRYTFLGIALRQGDDRGNLDPISRLSELLPDHRPDSPGDIGYKDLLDELWEQIDNRDRQRAKDHILDSQTLKHSLSVDSVERYLILEGQKSFETAWKAGASPEGSLLAHFLETVWKPVWTEATLG
jgi:hypothetical protein